jgi:hypothetical protein
VTLFTARRLRARRTAASPRQQPPDAMRPEGAGDCPQVQDQAAVLRLSKRVSLCRDAIHHAVTARLAHHRIAAPAAAGPDAAEERRRFDS